VGFRDRFYTPATARAILSWRILVGVGVAAGMIVAGLNPAVSIAVGVGAYVAFVGSAMPNTAKQVRIDPFTVQEPWRQFVQGAQRSAGKLHQTVEASAEGSVRDRMQSIVDKLDHGLQETWRIARRGDQIDDAVNRLDPTALRSKLATLQERPGDEAAKAIESVESQLASVDRLKEQSRKTANTLRLTQTRLDELVARAAEVSVGAGDTDAYEHDVEDLVVELEALRLAVEETRTA
jgi:hypothetical protein